MKQKYRFVGGGVSLVGNQDFTVFGQQAEFTEEYAREVYLGGAAFVTEEEFESLEIDPEDLAKYFGEFYYGPIPQDLEDKRRQAQHLYQNARAAYSGN